MLYNNKDLKKVRQFLRNNATQQEIMLWKYLKNSNLGFKFRRQYGIGYYIVDFCCLQKNLIIELDGSQHMDDKKYDEERTMFFTSIGFKTMRFWNNEVNNNINGVLLKIIKGFLEETTPQPLLG